ncbi:MAG: AmmeMemoRadiSam system radical SAM enzyme [Candidatus Koribacter versatilis]|uniref:AmmeMemoRadiSam system radical SAM enzyme n=1 Tax=Candidatus Korobacter versatilis TaxID=658062 RepID=A0A932A659_9BACT|nr:AmmeMemoRadiSam system radical SAM enzyme [Candidatus Koribacter versatilis]
MATTLKEVLYEHVREGARELWAPIDKNRIRCYSCGHECPIAEGQAGVCKVRFNLGGKLLVPWGYVGGVQCDPIEKKPFFHAYPGALAYSFGMLGCDLHCGYCQNWVTSQALRDPSAVSPPLKASPEALVADALRLGARAVVSTYNEPLITSEWAVAIFKEAKRAGLVTGFVSNGNGTPQVLEYIRPHIDLYKVDLKSFDDRHYRELGGRIEPILRTIRALHDMGFWMEIVTLIIPGFNDSSGELQRAADFLARVSPDIPWHVTAFHSDYKMEEAPNTPVETLLRAADIGKQAGLRYIYAGNLPGRVGDLENTRCHTCHELLIERHGYLITGYHLTPQGTCPKCATALPGRWAKQFAGQISDRPFLPRSRTGLVSLP